MVTIILSSHQILEDDITNHRPAIDAVNVAAKQFMQTKDTKDAKVIQTKLDNVNSRYGVVDAATNKHGEGLNALSEKLAEFEREVDDFEDWLLPDLETLESKEVMTQDMPENVLRVGYNVLKKTNYVVHVSPSISHNLPKH